jgi:hypothetical protein
MCVPAGTISCLLRVGWCHMRYATLPEASWQQQQQQQQQQQCMYTWGMLAVT